MADETRKATVRRVSDADSIPVEVTAAETNTAPEQTLAEVPSKETIPTGNDSVDVTAGGLTMENTKADLQEAARSRGVEDSGTKEDLLARIEAHDSKGAHKPEVLYPHEED